jgi:hypothetical protein
MTFWLKFSLKIEAKDEKMIETMKERMKVMKGWRFGPYFLALMTLHMNSLTPNNFFIINNLESNNELKSVQISHYWSQDFMAPPPNLKQV